MRSPVFYLRNILRAIAIATLKVWARAKESWLEREPGTSCALFHTVKFAPVTSLGLGQIRAREKVKWQFLPREQCFYALKLHCYSAHAQAIEGLKNTFVRNFAC
jgi:hypothetical protein